MAPDATRRDGPDEVTDREPVWQAEPRFRIAVEALLDGLAIYSSIRDADGEIVDFRCEFANQAVVANGGLAPEEQVGRTMRETFPDVVESGLFARHVRAVETGEPQVIEVPWYEDAGASGAFEIHTARLDDGCVVVFRNVTHQRETEAALRASEARLEGFLQALPAGVAVVDATGPLFVNAFGAELLGQGVHRDVPVHELTRRYSLVRFGTDETYPLEEMPLRRALREGVTVEATDVAIRRAEGDIPLDSFATPIRDAAGEVVAAISVFHDATERRARDQQLQAALTELEAVNTELSDFTAHAAHDLAEPLRAIAGFAELIRRSHGGALDAEAREWLDHMLDGAARMDALIDDLVTYSRAGTVRFEPASVDLDAVVATARGALDGALAARGAVVDVGALPVVSGDASQLARCFQNLLANAVKFARPGIAPVISIDAVRTGDAWEISVTDNGRGIPPNERERVFAPFHRGAGDAGPGSGLGLAICRRIAELHGGALRLEASSETGSQFCLALPVTGHPHGRA